MTSAAMLEYAKEVFVLEGLVLLTQVEIVQSICTKLFHKACLIDYLVFAW